jgi:hypothetical protein
MSITISGGRKVTKSGDPVTVTLGATADVGDGVKHKNSIAIQFTGTECHVIQIFMRTKVVGGKDSAETIGVDSGGLNTFKFSDDAAPDWLVDTTSAAVPYYDFGYAGEMNGNQYIMIDAPTMSRGKFDLPGSHDLTTFDAYAFCLSDKDVVSIVHWSLVRHYYQLATPSASILEGSAWFDRLYLGRRVLSKQGYKADVYLPTACMK